MRTFLMFGAMLFSTLLFGQDKVYLKNNALLEGKVFSLDEKHILINLKDSTSLIFNLNEILLITLGDSSHYVVPINKKTKKPIHNKENWSLGINIISPMVESLGLRLDKRLNRNISLELNQVFNFDSGLSHQMNTYSTLLMHNYLGGDIFINFIVSFGFGFNYTETNYNNYSYIIYQPRTNFSSSINYFFPLGIGLYFDATPHLSFSAEIFTSLHFAEREMESYLDLYNTGINIYFKF